MNKYTFTFLVFILACSSTKENKNVINELKGEWAFIDKYGTYVEAFFTDSIFYTYNMVNGKMPDLNYNVKNDSLYSSLRKHEKMGAIAGLQWLANDKIVLSTKFVNDTLERISVDYEKIDTTGILLSSGSYFEAYKKRYEAFLIRKGILIPEEIKAFKEKGEVPDYLKQN